MGEWTEPATTARGSVIVVGGRGESSRVYERFRQRLAVDGYRVAVIAPEDPGHPAGSDLDGAVRALLARTPAEVPIVLVGSDTGAAAVVRAADARIAGVVLAGLPVAADESPADWDDEVEARSACPVHRVALAEGVAAGHLAEEVRLVRPDELAALAVPALLVHGEADRIVPSSAVIDAAEQIEAADLAIIVEGRHDILNDVSHRSVAAEIVQFLERLRLPGAPRIVARPLAAERIAALQG